MGTKKQKGEKYDAYLVKDVEPIQEFMLNLLGTRTDNEAVCRFDIDMENLEAYIKRRNDENPEFRYTFFHVFCAALGRTIAERPRMNYFIRNTKYYERKAISITAIAKKQKKDGAEEGMIIMKYDKNSDVSPVEQMHESICKQVYNIRKSEEYDRAYVCGVRDYCNSLLKEGSVLPDEVSFWIDIMGIGHANSTLFERKLYTGGKFD